MCGRFGKPTQEGTTLSEPFMLSLVTGGAPGVLGDLLVHPQFKKTMDAKIAMTLCRQIAETRAIKYVYEFIEPQIREAYDLYVMTNGEQLDAALPMDWDSGLDDVIEALFQQYERSLTADWMGNAVVDTRLHKPPATEHAPDAIVTLAQGFAKDAWRVLIDSRDLTGDEPATLSTAKILSAVGFVESDIAEFLDNTPPPTAEAVTQAKDDRMRNIKEIMNAIHAACGGEYDAIAYEGLFENAIDDDDGIAASGATQLGASVDDVEAFRMYAMECVDNPAEALVDLLGNAPFEDVHSDETEGTVAGAGFVPPVAGSGQPAPPQSAPQPGVPKPKVPKAIAVGGIPPSAFEALKSSLKVKDEEIATALGISRQTFINYGKPTARVQFIPTDAQRQYLCDLIQEHINTLSEARNEIEGV